MFQKIKDWVFFKYGFRLQVIHVWMIFIFLTGVIVLVFLLASNKNNTPISPQMNYDPMQAPTINK